jgi:hypothetical protein
MEQIDERRLGKRFYQYTPHGRRRSSSRSRRYRRREGQFWVELWSRNSPIRLIINDNDDDTLVFSPPKFYFLLFSYNCSLQATFFPFIIGRSFLEVGKVLNWYRRTRASCLQHTQIKIVKVYCPFTFSRPARAWIVRWTIFVLLFSPPSYSFHRCHGNIRVIFCSVNFTGNWQKKIFSHFRSFTLLIQWFPKCGARPPGGGGARDPQGGRKRCKTILFTKNK